MERLDQPTITSDDRTFGMLTHLSALLGMFIPFGSIIGPLIAWSAKKEVSKFIDANGKSAINFNLTWTIVLAVLWILFIVQFLSSFPLMLLMEENIDIDEELPIKLILSAFIYLIPIFVIYLFKFIMMLVGTISASNGNEYRYPLTFRFIK